MVSIPISPKFKSPMSVPDWKNPNDNWNLINKDKFWFVCFCFIYFLTSRHCSTGSHRSKKVESMFKKTIQMIHHKGLLWFYQVNKEVKAQTEEVILSQLNRECWKRLIYLLCYRRSHVGTISETTRTKGNTLWIQTHLLKIMNVILEIIYTNTCYISLKLIQCFNHFLIYIQSTFFIL